MRPGNPEPEADPPDPTRTSSGNGSSPSKSRERNGEQRTGRYAADAAPQADSGAHSGGAAPGPRAHSGGAAPGARAHSEGSAPGPRAPDTEADIKASDSKAADARAGDSKTAALPASEARRRRPTPVRARSAEDSPRSATDEDPRGDVANGGAPGPLPPGPRPTIYRRAFPSEHLDEDAVKVLKRLHRSGYKAYLVGGCVRDLLLGRRPKDFDVATSARPHEVRSLFRNCRVIGRRFRLAHILFSGGKIIETATFRRDPTAAADEDTFLALAAGYDRGTDSTESGEFNAFSSSEGPSWREPRSQTGALRPSAKPRDDETDLLIRNDNVFGEPHEDALRRDFTINGLFYDVERGEVIDYVGGLHDIERRVVNTIGLPDVRFREDPVRILRAIKFSARLDLGIDPDCYDAMVAQREELRKAAKPRMLEEILRLLRGGASHRSVWLAWELGVLSVSLPELAVFLDDNAPRSRLLWGRLDAIDASVRSGRLPSDAVLLASLLLGPVEEAIEGASDPAYAYEEFMRSVTEALAVPRRLKERMRAVIGSQRRLRAGRAGTLARRDFFAEAVMLLELECAARGQAPPELHTELPASEGDVVVKRRRRRRRR